MTNIAVVIGGSALLVYVLFVRAQQPGAILSGWRWMVLSWGTLTLFAITSPASFDRMSTSVVAVGYVMLWVLAFVLGDVWSHERARADPPSTAGSDAPKTAAGDAGIDDAPQPDQGDLEPRVARLLLWMSVVGAAGFAYQMLSAAGSTDESGLLAELRELQTTGEIVGLGATVLQVVAFAGLPVSLILIGNSIRRDVPVPMHAWVGILSSASIYMISAGRQGLVVTSIACVVTVVASLRMRGGRYSYSRRIFGPLTVVFALFAGYFMFNVATRSVGGGTMDAKLEMIERVYGAYMDPGFRDSVRTLGVVGDTASELYFYLGTQMPGLTALLRDYGGGLDLGLGLFPYITRRIEWLFGVSLLDPVYDAQREVFLNLGMPGNFFLTAAGSTFDSFGVWGSLAVMWACGVLAGRHRARVQANPSGQGVAMQAMACAGAAFTVVFSPTIEAGWAFPVMWLLVIPRLRLPTMTSNGEPDRADIRSTAQSLAKGP